MEPKGVERKLAAILSADVAGFSRLMEADEEASLRLLNAYREVVDGLIARHRGRVFGSAGDSVLAEFASAVEALRCAVQIQQELEKRNGELSQERRMRFRIGVNVGDVMIEGGNLFGDGVNVAARLQSLAEPGGICISRPAFDYVRGKLELEYEDLGEQRVKNIAEPVRTYRVRMGVAPGAGAAMAEKKPGLSPRLTAVVAVVLCTLLGAAGLILWSITQRPPSPPEPTAEQQASALPLPEKPSIAVLPFDNLSGDAEQEYFSNGITEDIITELSRFPDLFVIARNSVFTYKGKPVKVQQVGRELGVRYVLEGSVRKADQRVRISAQLVDATTGHHLWAERYDRLLEDVFAVQDEITQKIVAALAVEMTVAERRRSLRKETENLEAYDYLLRGRGQFFRFTREANDKAKEMYRQAIELDPSYARAYANLAIAHLNDWRLGWSESRPQSLERALELAQRAVALDDSVPVGHAALGDAYLWTKRYERAVAEFERALSLNPNDADGYRHLAGVLTWAGRPEEALVQIRKAMRLNPNHPFIYLWELGHAYFVMEWYEEAIEALTSLKERNPDFWPAYVYLAASHARLGQMDAARAELAETLKLNPGLDLAWAKPKLPYKDPADLERLLAALGQAGLAQ